MRKISTLVMGTAVVVALSACGGGGGGGPGKDQIPAGFGSTPVASGLSTHAGGGAPPPIAPPALPISGSDGDDVVEKVWFPGEPTPPTPTPTSTGEGPSDGPDSPPALTKGAGATPPAAGTYLGAGPPQQPVPEPETVFLFLIGSLAIVALLWRRGYLTLPNGARDLAHR